MPAIPALSSVPIVINAHLKCPTVSCELELSRICSNGWIAKFLAICSNGWIARTEEFVVKN